MSDRLKEETSQPVPLEVSAKEYSQLENLLELVKTIGSTDQLALAGLLAARSGETIVVAGLLPSLSPKLKNNLSRHLRQLEKAGFIQIQEWQSPRPGLEPEPSLVTFNPDYARQAQTMIAALRHTITIPNDEPQSQMDEPALTLRRFMKDGKVLAMPAQLKRQQYILQEVAKAFEPGVRYTERQVDAILKPIYEYDHCTLRRYLVDFKLLYRAEGVYWKENPVLAPV